MANLNTARSWSVIWDKIQGFFGFSGVESPFTSTLAGMRGNTPKIFPLTPNPYGSYVYE